MSSYISILGIAFLSILMAIFFYLAHRRPINEKWQNYRVITGFWCGVFAVLIGLFQYGVSIAVALMASLTALGIFAIVLPGALWRMKNPNSPRA